MKWALVLALVTLMGAAHAESWKLPVVSVRYEVAEGIEEEEEEGFLSPTYLRHSLALRVKEEMGHRIRATLTSRFSHKDYESDADDYWYIAVVPGLEYSLGQAFALGTEFSVKKALFDGRDSEGLSRDYLDLGTRLSADWKIRRELKLDAWLRSTYSLYESSEKSRQAYSVGVGLTGRVGGWNLGARYRGTVRVPLGDGSLQEIGGYHLGSVSVSWGSEPLIFGLTV